jgi:hypothetical protein
MAAKEAIRRRALEAVLEWRSSGGRMTQAGCMRAAGVKPEMFRNALNYWLVLEREPDLLAAFRAGEMTLAAARHAFNERRRGFTESEIMGLLA